MSADANLILQSLTSQKRLLSKIDGIVDNINNATTVNKAHTGIPVIGIDLDRTMIYSANSMGTNLPDDRLFRVTEMYKQEPLTYMTDIAYTNLELLSYHAHLVPVTTRNQEQYSRVKIPGTTRWELDSPKNHYSVTTNGAVILINGSIYLDWQEKMREKFKSISSFDVVTKYLQQYQSESWLLSMRHVENYYHYMIIDVDNFSQGTLKRMEETMSDYGWVVSLQGRKLYFIPNFITKGAALAEVARLTKADYVMAAGDSILDQSMLEMADVSFRPKHGELENIDYMFPGLRRTTWTGIYAGEEITSMMVAQLFHGL